MPQLGAAIGGLIGGWISPTQVNGPRIGDQADQSSQEGQPIPWVMGTCGWLQGNIVDKSKVREVKKTDDGKGSGTEVNTFEAHQDFCIMICESSEHRESLMVGVLIVKVDGKIVYDMRPESNFGADNAKFLQNHSFYDGNEAQLPDPTMEALPHNGVGNTPYYRGVFTMVARDINLSQHGNRIPVYQFVMVGAGEQQNETTEYLVAPSYGRFQNAHWPLVDPISYYRYTGTRDVGGAGTETYSADTLQEVIDYFSGLGYNDIPQDLSFYQGYSCSTDPDSGVFGIDAATTQLDVTENTSLGLVYNIGIATSWNAVDPASACPLLPYISPGLPEWHGFLGGELVRIAIGIPPLPSEYAGYNNCTGLPSEDGYFPYLQGSPDLFIQVSPVTPPPTPVTGDPCLLQIPVLLPDSQDFVIDCDGVVSPVPTYAESSGDYRVLQLESTYDDGGRLLFAKRTVGPIIETSSPDNNQAFWEAAYATAVSNGTMDAGLVWPTDYPVGTSTAYKASITTTSLETDPLGLDTALTRISIRGGLTAEDIDVTEMDQQVLGYMITQSYTGADSIRPLMTAFKSYGSEYDAKLRFHKHGENIQVIVDPQDIIQGSEESDQTTRDQQVEFPRTYSLTYIDATQDYTARPQVDRRISSDVRAIGEIQTQVAVVLPPDYARQLANVGMKVNWARAVGSREFSVPYAGYDVYLKLVAGKPLAMDSQRRILSESSLQDGEIQIKALYDRQSAYTSDIQATPALPPTPPPSNIGGVTLLALLNIGVLRDQDDRVGIYVAAAGILDAWPGCLLQVSYDDEVSWQTAIDQIIQASTIGYLTEPLPLAPAEGDDVTNTLSVSVHGGQLNTITRQQYLNESNPYAIITDTETGECELGQFQFADEIEANVYDLTTLVRGGLNSTPAAHAAGARFTMLDSVYFFEIPSGMIGRTIKFRAVTFGTPPESNAVYSLLFDPAVSQTEWEPTYLTGAYGSGSSFSLSVTPRHRLGNDVTPIASSNFIGYRWTATDGTVTQTKDTVDPSVVFDLADFPGMTMTYTAAQLNRITGPGPSVSITL